MRTIGRVAPYHWGPMPNRIVFFLAVLGLLLVTAAVASAQTASTLDPRPLGSTLTAETLADLPLGGNVYSALETTQSELIADRFNASGLNVGEAARIGGFLGSWSQTLFRIGEIDITDPAGSGAPLLFPELLLWRRVDITTGLMPTDLNTAGLATTLDLRRPTTQWTTLAHVFGSGGSLAAPTPDGVTPPIARLDDWIQGSGVVSGPLTDRLGIVAGGSWTQASKFIRELTPVSDSDLASGFAHLVYAPSASTEWRTLGWLQATEVPSEYRRVFPDGAATHDESRHIQSTWERRPTTGVRWRVLGGLTHRSRRHDTQGMSSVTVDRLLDGPIPSIVSATGDATTNKWTLAARVVPAASSGLLRHITELGVNLDHASVKTSGQFAGSIGELVDSAPARVWVYTHPNSESKRQSTTFSAFVRDTISLTPTWTLDAGLRFESVTGSSDGAATDVTWYSFLPRAVLQWEFADRAHALVFGYRRSANPLSLDLLSFGDPAGPTAAVTRWSAAPGPLTAVVDQVGPGTGGDPAFSRIDPDLKRPYTDEWVVGIESRRQDWLRFSLTGIARREANLVGVVDTGVPIESYSIIGIPDPGRDFVTDADDQVLEIYNRLPSSFAQNSTSLPIPVSRQQPRTRSS